MTKSTRADNINEVISLLAGVKRSMQGRTYHCKDGSSLTSGQLSMLFTLKQHGPISAQEIATRLAMSPGAVSQLVESLSESNYIVRTPRTSDRRVIDLELSDTGLQQITSIEHERHIIIREMTDDLSDTELKQLISALQKMLHVLQKHAN